MKIFRFQQKLEQPQERDIAAAVRRELGKLPLGEVSGKSVAITAGSRGIPNIVAVLATSVAVLKEAQAKPFIVPTMGSHGGGTAKGQKAVLERYGITPSSIGCPIRGDMRCQVIGKDHDTAIYFSSLLLEADAVLVVGRVKCHTSFVGEIESGLCKMIAVGGGRYIGAETIHQRAREVGIEKAVVAAARVALDSGKIFGGLAIVDNAYHQTAFIEAVSAQSTEAFIAHERRLLVRANDLLAQLPFSQIDLCYLKEMGKNVSGTGSDPNVIGKKPGDSWRIRVVPRTKQATITKVCCSSLNSKSGGNAIGVRLHDAITTRLAAEINWDVTRINAETSGALALIEQPPTYSNDKEMLSAMIDEISPSKQQPTAVFAPNTRDLKLLYASENLLREVERRDDLVIDSDLSELNFDSQGYVDLDF